MRGSVCPPVCRSARTAGLSADASSRSRAQLGKLRDATGGGKNDPAPLFNATLSRGGMKNGLREIGAITINISCMIFWVWGEYYHGRNRLQSKEPHLDGKVKSSTFCADSRVSGCIYWSFSKLCMLMRCFWEKHVNERKYWMRSCSIRTLLGSVGNAHPIQKRHILEDEHFCCWWQHI